MSIYIMQPYKKECSKTYQGETWVVIDVCIGLTHVVKDYFIHILFQYVSRKKTKKCSFLKVNARSLFDKKCVFSESQGEKQKK